MKVDISRVKPKNLIFFIFLFSRIFTQDNYISSNSDLLFSKKLINSFTDNPKTELNNIKQNILFNYDIAINTGHSNIDNNAEFYTPGAFTQLISFRYELRYKWLQIEFEPYKIEYKDKFISQNISDTWQYTNNNNPNNQLDQTEIGLKQSRFIIHYKSLGFSYGNMSHWWGPGQHSSIAFSTNSISQKTYSIGTFNDIKIDKVSLGINIIAIPYKNKEQVPLYFSGINAKIIYHSDPELTFGFHRTFLSADFKSVSPYPNNLKRKWTIYDATKLVIEPLFGQSKTSLDYTVPGTPGFDAWDQVITGYFQIFFPKDDFLIYVELASDDNRGNFTDLRAHWDHTLGYNFGFRKFINLASSRYFILSEYLNTVITNTNSPNFYRGSPSAANYYIYESYDYFSYEGRRMGAHSGSSSDDLIFIFGLQKSNNTYFISYNKERHGLKYMEYPEIKSELSFIYNIKYSKHSFKLIFEYENIKNFGYENKSSSSRLFWFGYSIEI